MIVADIMAEKLITIKTGQSLKKAHELMTKNSIRHLPVVNKHELLGIITESDIRSAFILSNRKPADKTAKFSNPDKMPVEDYMTNDPLTVYPETHIEDAALIIYKNKVGALPVLKQNKLVGIISITDLVGLFIELMGILHSSSRIDVVMGKDPENFDAVSKIIQAQNLSVISTSMAPYPKDKKKRVYSFRLDLCDTKQVAVEIKKAGFKVLAAIE